MNWSFIFFWLSIFAGIIVACSFMSYGVFTDVTYGIIVGIICDIAIIIYCLTKTPWH